MLCKDLKCGVFEIALCRIFLKLGGKEGENWSMLIRVYIVEIGTIPCAGKFLPLTYIFNSALLEQLLQDIVLQISETSVLLEFFFK